MNVYRGRSVGGLAMTLLPIERINLYAGQYKVHLVYSRRVNTLARALIVEMTADGLTGWGEVSRGYYYGDAVGNSTYPLAREWARILLGRDALNPTKALTAPGVSDGDEDPWQDGNDTPRRLVREAFCIALYDLAGQAKNKPFHALLGKQLRSQAPGMPVIHIREPQDMARIAKKWCDVGYRYLKIKVGSAKEKDIETVAAVREAVGPDVGLHVDFNLGYDLKEDAIEMARWMEAYGIDVFEDPLKGNLADYAEIRKEIDLPLMIDNYSWWPMINEVIELQAADIINHHPSIQGGPDLIMRIDRLATSAGLRTAIGSGGTFGIQDAAFQNMAAVMSHTRPCEDLGPGNPFRMGLGEDYERTFDPEVLVEPYQQEDGIITITDRPGLGIQVDRDKLMSYVVESSVLE